MSIYDQFATDAQKEAEGARVEFPPNKDGTIPTFIIAATNRSNQKYASALDKATRPFKKNIDALKNEAAEQLFRKVFVETILKGWENIQDRDGSPIPYNKENAEALFTKLPRLYDALNERAGSIETFKEEVREEDAKN